MFSTQGAAKRMEGMTPCSVVSLLKHAKRAQGLGVGRSDVILA